LLPALVWLSNDNELDTNDGSSLIVPANDRSRASTPAKLSDDKVSHSSTASPTSRTKLAIITAAAAVVVHTSSGDRSLSALALSYGVIQATAYRLFDGVRREPVQRGRGGGNGPPNDLDQNNAMLTVVRNIALAATLFVGLAAFVLESMKFSSLAYHGPLSDNGAGLKSVEASWAMMVMQAIMSGLQLIVVSHAIALHRVR
jgi:hypothetical protein